MKRISAANKSTAIGLLGGLFVLALAALFSHQHLAGLFNLGGLLIVVGGTLAATVVSRSVRDLLRVAKSLKTLMDDGESTVDPEMAQLLEVAYWHRLGQVRAAEQAVEQVRSPFLRTGARLVIDREPVEDIVKVMQWRIAGMRTKEQGDAQILRTMATFAPAFGMLGTLFGLIQILGNLGQVDLGQIGAAMSFALTTTLYGLVLANMVFKPLAIKMERRLQHRIMMMNVMLEGVVLLYQRRHPAIIKETLTACMRQQQESTQPQSALLRAA
ncbi:MAG: MotA/TolQ/ExbB proton channel family protein [Gammaproteobacteria bacterium]